METSEFADHIYQVWSRTTGAEDRYWMPEEHFDRSGRFNIYAIKTDAEGNHDRKLIASGLSDQDSDFISAVHGCFADLIRVVHTALDEAETADYNKDSRECRIAELEMEADELRVKLSRAEGSLEAARADTEFWRNR